MALYIVVTVVWWSFTSRQHQKSYQDGHRVVIARTDGDFIILALWENTRSAALCPDFPHYPDTEIINPRHIVIILSGRLGSNRYQVFKPQAPSTPPSHISKVHLPYIIKNAKLLVSTACIGE